MTTEEVYKYILLMVLIATSFLVSGSADCVSVPRYTIPNAPAEEYIEYKWNFTQVVCVSATISWMLSSYISTAMQFHSTSLCTNPMDM